MKKTGLAHSDWRVGSKMAWRFRLGWIDRSGGPDDESDEINLMKKTGLGHITWRVGARMTWRCR